MARAARAARAGATAPMIRPADTPPPRPRRPALRRGTALALATWAAGATASSVAQPTPVLWLIEPADPAVRARIEGQTGDLDWRIERDPEPLPAGGAAAPTALVRGARRGARAVAWLEPLGEGWTVEIVEVETRRWMTRRIPAGRGRLGASAAAEGAALVLRTALEAMGRGDPLGDAVEIPEPEPTPAPTSSPREPGPPREPSPPPEPRPGGVAPGTPTPGTPEPATPEPATSAGGAPSITARIGWAVAFDGAQAPPVQGPAAALGLALRGWAVEVFGGTALAGDAELAGLRFSLRRSTFGLAVRRDLLDGEALDLEVGARFGGVLYARRTDDPGPDPGAVAAADDRTLAAHAGLEAAVRWAFAPPFALRLAAGVDGMSRVAFAACAGAPDGDGCPPGDDASLEPWVIQPRVELALTATWPP